MDHIGPIRGPILCTYHIGPNKRSNIIRMCEIIGTSITVFILRIYHIDSNNRGLILSMYHDWSL